MKCYLDGVTCDDDCVVCCRLHPRKYDIVIVDECGLTRRHMVSFITQDVLGLAFTDLKSALSVAQFTVLAQAELSEQDVHFYSYHMGFEPHDRSKIRAMSIVKPILSHNVEWTTQFYLGVAVLREKYTKGLRLLKTDRKPGDNDHYLRNVSPFQNEGGDDPTDVSDDANEAVPHDANESPQTTHGIVSPFFVYCTSRSTANYLTFWRVMNRMKVPVMAV